MVGALSLLEIRKNIKDKQCMKIDYSKRNKSLLRAAKYVKRKENLYYGEEIKNKKKHI